MMISRPAAVFFCALLLLQAEPSSAAAADGTGQILDAFPYADAAQAGEAWKASEGTPPVDVSAENGGPAFLLTAPFATQPKLARTVIDRRVRLDLRGAGGFALEVEIAPAEAVKHLSLYFHSRGGWYSGGGVAGQKGWQSVRFPKAEFGIEEKPGGWGEIDGIRIAAWRGEAIDAVIRLRRLVALESEISLIARDGAVGKTGEVGVLCDLLAELGLGPDVVSDAEVLDGGLGRRRIAVLSDRGDLNDKAVAALVRFVESGGKLFVCYAMPPRLGPVLGFKNAEYVRESRPGEFAEIRFPQTGLILGGSPPSVRQHSWNITTMQPDGGNARVDAQWYDDAGRSTGRPALLLSGRGAFFSHIVLGDDRENMKQMLAAIFGHLVPELKETVAAAAVNRAGQVGHCGNERELAEYLKSAGDAAAKRSLAAAEETLSAARAQLSAGNARPQFSMGEVDLAIELGLRGHRQFLAAYLNSQPSPGREGRAMWDHAGTGPFPGDWDRTAEILHENGFNMIVPNMLWAGEARYASDVLPRGETFRRWGDQIEQCVKATKKYGLEVHVWKVNFNLGTASKEFIAQMRREGRTQVSVDGKPIDWLCPSHPENRRLERESMLEVAKKYAIDGLHFDYIRYPDERSCFCDGCRRRFEAESGHAVKNWPADCFHGPRQEEYNDWRCRQITTLVADVHRELKRIRPEAKLSAAVFGDYPECRGSVAQDWPLWIRQGFLDFVCPMDYTKDDEQFARLVRKQMKLVAGRVPVYAGIGIAGEYLSPDRVVGQIHIARSLGTGGFCIFALDASTAASVVPAIGVGAGKTPARPPHLP